jgi:hypothetical protein
VRRPNTIFQYFSNPTRLIVVLNRLLRGCTQFKPAIGRTRCGEPRTHSLDLRRLLFQVGFESVNFVLLLPHGLVLLQEFVQ